MKIVAYTTEYTKKEVTITGSTTLNGKSETSNNASWLLEALTLQYGKPVLRVCWDLDATIAPILKLLGKELCKKLYKTNKCFYRPYSMFYIPGKVFSIKPVFSRIKSNYYDIAQYFPDREKPASAQEIAQLGEQLLKTLNKMGLQPTKLTSPVAMWEQSVMNHLSLPTAWDMPKEAAEFAWKCSGKLWIEAYQIGYWK